MSHTAGRRYGEALERLKENNPVDYRAIKSRVESWKTIADKWRTRSEELEAELTALRKVVGRDQ